MTVADREHGFAIWWLDESECRLIANDEDLAGRLPAYVMEKISGMQGRPKRGRLWFPTGVREFELPRTPAIDSQFFFTRGGLAILARDAVHALGCPGYLTTLNLRPWFPV
jgi:hypothetical protein